MAEAPGDGPTPAAQGEPDPAEVMVNRRFAGLLVFVAIVGVITSLVAWCFLELVHQIQTGVFTDLPKDLGYDHGAPNWWYLVVLGIAGLITAAAITRLPGNGGHTPANGLSTERLGPEAMPGVILAALASIGLGAVVGPEAPLIAMGGGLGIFAARRLQKDAPPQVVEIVAASSTFAAVSFLFGSPLIAAIILIEAIGIGGSQLKIILVPGLMAAGIGSLVSVGMGSWTGLSTSDISIGVLPLPEFARPDLTDFLWTIPFAVAVAVLIIVIFALARPLVDVIQRRPLLLTPVAGLIIAGLAIGFSEITNHPISEVLFSGQDQVGGLVTHASAYSVGALIALLAFKGLAYSVSLSGFRGGPIFPAIFLGAAAGLAAAHLPGFETTPAVAVGIGAATAAALKLPLSGVTLALLLTSQSGLGSGPLIIVGVIVAYLVALAFSGYLDDRGGAWDRVSATSAR
jgi:H+/Cl- antiporter ClcA